MISFSKIYNIHPDCKAVSSVVILLDTDPLTKIAVAGQHSVWIKPLDNVNRAINSGRQQPSRYEKDQNLDN